MSTEQQIRNRRSYKFYKKIYELAKEGIIPDVLKTIHQYMEEGNKHGSQSNADYAMESINQVIKDHSPTT